METASDYNRAIRKDRAKSLLIKFFRKCFSVSRPETSCIDYSFHNLEKLTKHFARFSEKQSQKPLNQKGCRNFSASLVAEDSSRIIRETIERSKIFSETFSIGLLAILPMKVRRK